MGTFCEPFGRNKKKKLITQLRFYSLQLLSPATEGTATKMREESLAVKASINLRENPLIGGTPTLAGFRYY
jgi:hypothetical protein